MASVDVRTRTGDAAGSADLDDAVFGITPNQAVLHQVVTAQLAAARSGTHSTLTRAEVRGGGAKPWRQKGTGRARQGSRRSPQWRGGGVVFGPHPRDHDQRMPAKMRRAALKGVLSAKQAAGELRVVEGFALDEIKTRALIEHLDAWGAQGKVLLVLAGRDETVERSCANVREVRVILADSLNVVELLEADTVIFTRDALTRAQEVYA